MSGFQDNWPKSMAIKGQIQDLRRITKRSLMSGGNASPNAKEQQGSDVIFVPFAEF